MEGGKTPGNEAMHALLRNLLSLVGLEILCILQCLYCIYMNQFKQARRETAINIIMHMRPICTSCFSSTA